MLLHIFGALFGLVLSWILYRDGCKQHFEKEKSDSKTGKFSMLGKGYVILQLIMAFKIIHQIGWSSFH